jgi:cytoskeletal protein RodZ
LKPRLLILGLVAILVPAVMVPAFGRAAGTGSSAPHRQGHRGTTAHPAARAHRAAADHRTLATAKVSPLDAADVAKLAATGSLDVPVTVTAAATVSVIAETAVGSETTSTTGTAPDGSTVKIKVPKNYARVFVPTSTVAPRAGTVVVPVELAAAGRAAMSRGERVQLLLKVDLPGAGPSLDMLVPMAG